ILCKDSFEMRVFSAKILQEAFASISFTIILRTTIWVQNYFWTQRYHIFLVRMNDASAKHLVVIGCCAVLVFLFAAVRARDLARRKMSCTIARYEHISIHVLKFFEPFSPLERSKYFCKSWSETFGVDLVQSLS